ncbi:hypothetical protein P3T76_001432 [Phytophthora citrophthora]|uniref:Uncharacterized protein n=1 Tax=Phytophthora citrophthora TaxID=4793 RepID=A0AAD9LUI9_9STRA|nr:hypothetical protein P3T76_001432 [Phytophthora citrophthora]
MESLGLWAGVLKGRRLVAWLLESVPRACGRFGLAWATKIRENGPERADYALALRRRTQEKATRCRNNASHTTPEIATKFGTNT